MKDREEINENNWLDDIIPSVIRVKIFQKCKVTYTGYEIAKNVDKETIVAMASNTAQIANCVCNNVLDWYGVRKKEIVWGRLLTQRNIIFVVGEKYYVKRMGDLLENGDLYGDDKTIKYLGKILGYPKCCINAFVKDAQKSREVGKHPLSYAYDRYVKQCIQNRLPVSYCEVHKRKEPIIPYMILDKDGNLLEADAGIHHIPCNPFCKETWFDYAYFNSWKNRVLYVMKQIAHKK